MNHQTLSVPQIGYQSPQVTTQPVTESTLVDSSLAVLVFSLGDDLIASLNKAMAFLIVVDSSRETMQVDRQGLLNATTIKVKDILLGNALSLSDQGMQHGPGVSDSQAVQTIIPNNAAFQTKDLDSYDSDCDDVLNAKAVLMDNISNYRSDVISEGVDHKPIDYEKLNRLFDDFGKHFTPQQELSAKQAFWLRMSNPISKLSDASPIKIKAPKKLPKVFLVNKSLKKLKFHLPRVDNMVKIRTTPDASTEDLLNEIMEEQADVLHGIVEQAKAKQPFDNALDFACCPDCSLVSGLQIFKTYDGEPLSAHELSCALGKTKKTSHQPKAKDTDQEKLYLLHIDLCGVMHVVSINVKRCSPYLHHVVNPGKVKFKLFKAFIHQEYLRKFFRSFYFDRGNTGFYDDHYDNPLLTKKIESEPIIWDIGDEEEEYPFINKYLSFQEEPIMLVEEESCPVYDIDNEEESCPVYDIDIEDAIEEEEGLVGKRGIGGEEDNIEDFVVVADDICYSMIQTTLSINFEEDINKNHMS
nr:hypothetical protein [Tanacetum cinerariifolium]